MRYISLPIFAAALVLANPALAEDQQPDSQVIQKLNDPAFQDNMVSVMSGFMVAMMDLPIGQFAGAMDKAIPKDMRRGDGFSSIDPDATLGDLARRDDPNFERNTEEKMRQGTAMLGIMASEFGALIPQLKTIGERMKRRMEETQ
ncbi:MAG: hypothetical protein ABJF89_02410 [Parasphingorhabdus sp.]|uniref:hypothetical protein n=1 Tax=Parasphingorhabdus sp. TaxID=2709688 RepID=UPI0032668596